MSPTRKALVQGFPVLCLALVSPAFAQTHDHGATTRAAPAGEPLWSQADQFYDPAEMADARAQARQEMGGGKQAKFLFDRLEYQSIDDEDVLLWDADAWRGGDIDRLWFKSEGEYSFDESQFAEAELQALWSHAFAAFWDVQAGIRQDFEPDGRTHAVLGVQGLAPYWFEVDAAAFLSTDGDLTARIETEYELRLSQRLILQPRAEVELSAQNIPETQTGAGLSHGSVGARLRYEIRREIAPYIGVEWSRSFGETANFLRAAGEDIETTAIVAGVRLWW